MVQGVGFRPFVYRIAQENNLDGYVLNLGGSGVEIRLEGLKDDFNNFIDDLKNKNPPLSRIDDLNVSKIDQQGFEGFRIKKSQDSDSSSSSSVIPPDVSICDECVEELFDSSDRRYKYPFIVCTNCGPRYSIIEDLPYDRNNTSMKDFEMCDYCRSEYEDPSNRRYHAQPVSCSENGPQYSLFRDGNRLDVQDPIKKASKLIEEGDIGIIKGVGGMHIVCDASSGSESIIQDLRNRTHRPEKPFAIMARDIESVERFSDITEKEKEELSSYRKPIMLVNKSSVFNEILSESLAPGLHNIGVMLPYSGVHHLIFHYLDTPALIMTSANMPDMPMFIRNERVLDNLDNVVDFFLLHNREILNRNDDSVIRYLNNERAVIRRSRGFVPLSLETKFDFTGLALGSELKNTISLVKNGSIFPSQYLGNTSNLEVMNFLKGTLNHLKNLLKIKNYEMVLTDLHPLFNTTNYGKEISNKQGIPHYKIQHHVSHAASLLVEYPEDEMIVIDADGAGYGWDEKTWGGEIIYISPDEVERTHHIDYYPLPGGDLAAKYPIRSLIGLLSKIDESIDIRDVLNDEFMINSLNHGKNELEMIKEQIRKEINIAYTSSTGRFLDAISCLLGICCDRNYEGEAAMKLESYSINGNDLGWEVPTENNLIKVQDLIPNVIESEKSIRDIGYTIHKSLARSFSRSAIKAAENKDVKTIGFTGGVSYNKIITEEISKICEHEDYKFRQTNEIPRGDGGVSIGQAYLGGLINDGKLDPESLK